jgi:hypothetical protein
LKVAVGRFDEGLLFVVVYEREVLRIVFTS